MSKASASPAIAEATPRNWFYVRLNGASLLFVVTALAYAVLPLLEEKAAEAGQPVTSSPVRSALREHGWWWLLVEAGLVGLFALASMGLDRWRRYRDERRG